MLADFFEHLLQLSCRRDQLILSFQAYDFLLTYQETAVNKSQTSPKTDSPIRHSHCNIRITSKHQALDKVQKQAVQAKQSIQSLSASLNTGDSYRFNTRMIYRMVGALADFSEEYKSVKEIVMRSKNLEASSVVQFTGHSDGFHCHPAFIDALSQSAGFVMNANDDSDLSARVCVNHGWKGFKFFRQVDPNRKYSTYLRLEEIATKTWEGDLVVLDGDDIVAIFNGITVSDSIIPSYRDVLTRDSCTRCLHGLSKWFGPMINGSKHPEVPKFKLSHFHCHYRNPKRQLKLSLARLWKTPISQSSIKSCESSRKRRVFPKTKSLTTATSSAWGLTH